MNRTAMTKAEQMIDKFNKQYDELRKNLKEVVQGLIDEEKIDYAEAIEIFKASRYFNISPYIIDEGIFSWYNNGLEDKYRTIYFTEVADWITSTEGEVTEECDAAGDEDPYKQLYDYAVEHDVIGYVFDW